MMLSLANTDGDDVDSKTWLTMNALSVNDGAVGNLWWAARLGLVYVVLFAGR